MEEKNEEEAFAVLGKSILNYILAFFKWLLLSAALGAICGSVGSFFHKSIDLVTEFRMEHNWLVWFLPLAGMLTLLFYRACKVSFGTGTNLIIETVNTNEHVPVLLAPLIFVGTLLSHLFGASVGREGAALQLGGSIGHNFGELLRMDEDDVRVFSMCGMAACFSALFGTPLTAAVFVLEVIQVGMIRYNAFLPCVIAAYSASLTAGAWGVEPLSFALVHEIPSISLPVIGQVLLLAVLCALVSILFCISIHMSTFWSARLLKNPYLRIAAGGFLLAVVSALFSLYDYNGAGTHVIQNAVSGSARPEAFFLKILLTALCVGVGYRGGEIVPTMFVGATFGCLVGPFLGLNPDFAAALGLVALFCSVVNCPIASVFLAIELFGTIDLPLFVIAIAVSFVLSGYFGLYSSQKIFFSKIKQKIVDINTR